MLWLVDSLMVFLLLPRQRLGNYQPRDFSGTQTDGDSTPPGLEGMWCDFSPRWILGSVRLPQGVMLLLMVKSQRTTVWMFSKPCKSWDKLTGAGFLPSTVCWGGLFVCFWGVGEWGFKSSVGWREFVRNTHLWTYIVIWKHFEKDSTFKGKFLETWNDCLKGSWRQWSFVKGVVNMKMFNNKLLETRHVFLKRLGHTQILQYIFLQVDVSFEKRYL